ncbi:DEAD/DEAH box helicase [Peribacillus simplex]|uniref:DEAD/DEAH box helicase n=1 Tax=Peribacillus simplex TaxID=1478 RepID=UPI0024C1928D|nr:AAA domain-containing protein [Peribacillus simplex]WHY58655.1 AAA domain-containing protein [Peribacillus simplex]
MLAAKVESQPCYINLTKRALSDINENLGYRDEFFSVRTDRIIHLLLSSQDSFLVHIEKATGRTEEELYVNLHFDSTENKGIMKYVKDQTFSLYGVVKDDGLLVTGIKFLPFGIGQANNRRVTSTLHFFINERSATSLTVETLEAIKNLPFAKEQSKFVKSRLESWEVYLDMIVEKAEQDEVTMDFQSARFTEHLRELNIHCPSLRGQVARRDLKGAEVSLLWEDDGKDEADEKIGTVRRFDFDKNIVEIELDEDYVELARQNKWTPVTAGLVHISNHGGLTQARRLRGGFRDLQNGVAKNPNLEYLLFEENPVMDTSSNVQSFEFKEAIQDNLNHYQRAAVKGALAAEDIYLIQGPPGTGKTTVIAEICYQNVERGLRTLVASQSNLAVDNALSKLLAHPKVRILRKGRTKSIEEEGKKFIEENVAETWKKQTLENIQLDIKDIDQLIEEKRKEIKKNQNVLKYNAEKLADIEKAPLVRTKLFRLQNELRHIQDHVTQLKNKEEKHELTEKELEQKLQQDSHEAAQLKVLLDNWEESNNFDERKATLQNRINRLRVEIEYLEAQESFDKASEHYKELDSQLERLRRREREIEDILMEIPRMHDVEIVSFINSRRDINSPAILQKQMRLSESIRMVNQGEAGKTQLASDNDTFSRLEKQLDIVIGRQKKVLVQYGYDTELAETLGGSDEYPHTDLMQLVPRLANRMMAFSEPSFLQNLKWKLTKKLPKQVEKLIEEYNQSIAAKKLLKETVERNKLRMVEMREAKSKLPLLTVEMLEALTDYYKQVEVKIENEIGVIHFDMVPGKNQVKKCHQLLIELRGKLDGEEPSKTVSELRRLVDVAVIELTELGTEEQYKKRLMIQKEEKEFACEKYGVQLKEITREVEGLGFKLAELQPTLEDLVKQVEENQKIVDYLSSINVEKEKMMIDKKNQLIKQRMERSDNHITAYMNQRMMKIEWSNMLQDAKDYDLREIKKLYIKHANVIGITCVQSAKKDFARDYPDFDVVIIDEVSKATPPELLLPMLKGKKVILVGDHHQLPPLIGQETLDEVIEKIPNPQKKDEVKANLQESLFERLFKTLPDQYKSTLRIQYRMHEDIMETITQFYEGESEVGYGLRCGLENSNRERDHYLDGQYVKRGQHIMWFDLPHEEGFFETKEKGMTSPYNGAELKIISELLVDLNAAVDKAKQEGRISEDATKNVGIISFYGEQVRRLRHLVDDLKVEHLKFRVGTVDRFQGMESEIIIASFVRNHSNKEEDIGFANDYRRLNVALSRAKELLIVTGSSKMFTVQAKRAASRKMYTRVIDTIRFKNGLRDHKGRVK